MAGSTTLVTKKVSAKIEVTPGTYLATDVLIPFTEWGLKKNYDMVEDDSIVGEAFMDVPEQGQGHILGPLTQHVDVDTIAPILEAGFGAEAAGVYTLPTDCNVKSLAFTAIDAVKTYKYAGVFIKSLEFTSEAEGRLLATSDLVAFVDEVRDDSAFPATATTPGTDLLHRHALPEGTFGQFRVGDHANALASGDQLEINNSTIGVAWNFDEMMSNTQFSLLPISGQAGRPTATFSFQISRHNLDTYLAFRDNHTKLQASVKYGVSATASLLFELPNFILNSVEVNSDDVASIDVVASVARNGIASAFTNSNMAFNSPVRATLDNS